VVFVDTCGDINIYKSDMNINTDTTGGSASGGEQAKESTCCGPTTGGGCAQTIGTEGITAKYDLNEWVGELAHLLHVMLRSHNGTSASYQIYALKAEATDLNDSTSPQEPLLRLSDAYPPA
jgi:hypothetical protein